MNVACNKCKKRFKMSILESIIFVGIEAIARQYMVCPHCGVEYSISFENSKIRFLKKTLKELYKNDLGEKRNPKIEETKTMIAEESERIRKIYEKSQGKRVFKW